MSGILENIPEFVDVRGLCELYGIGRSTAYRLIAEGEIRSVRLGRRILIPRWALPGLRPDDEKTRR